MRWTAVDRRAEHGGGVRVGLQSGEGHGRGGYRRDLRRRRPLASAVVLITLEGIDGAGKTTVAAALAERLGAVLLREPGGVALSERIRALVKDPALHVDPRAEALLYAAARAQLVAEQLRPRLAAGETVVLDRFVDSSLAYQGAGRGLGVEEVRRLNQFGTGGLPPDRTLLLRIDPETALARAAGRGEDRRPARAGGTRLLRRDRRGLRRPGGRRARALRRHRRRAAPARGPCLAAAAWMIASRPVPGRRGRLSSLRGVPWSSAEWHRAVIWGALRENRIQAQSA